MFKIVVFVPESYLAVVKNALFDAGAGSFDEYDSCSWQTRGDGQFRPLPGSDPFLGEHGVVEHVEEWRLEVVCPDHRIEAALDALVASHPYEVPAYEAYPIYQRDTLPKNNP